MKLRLSKLQNAIRKMKRKSEHTSELDDNMYHIIDGILYIPKYDKKYVDMAFDQLDYSYSINNIKEHISYDFIELSYKDSFLQIIFRIIPTRWLF